MNYRSLCLMIGITTSACLAVAQEPDQQELQNYAETHIRRLQFSTDDFTLSPEVKRAGFVVELRGPDVKRCKELYDKENWLQLLNASKPDKTNLFSEFPARSEIGTACYNLGDQNWQLFVATAKLKPAVALNKKELILVSIASPADDITSPTLGFFRCSFAVSLGVERFGEYGHWRKHPDDNGFLTPWRPNAGRSFIAYGPTGKYSVPIDRSKQEFDSEKQRLMDKRRLGELTETEHRDALVKLANDARLNATRIVTGAK